MTHVELAVAAPAEAEETVAAVLAACGTTGAWIPRPGEVRAYFPAPSPDLESRFASHWRMVTGEVLAFPLEVRPVPDQDWLAGYRAAARPIRIGDRLRIVPSGCEPDGPAAGPVVRIEPGLGFGTGEHATTRALLRWIHDGGPFDRVLDVGTGSGILALAALAGGAIAAIGLEPDGMALENAARNRDLNRARGLALVRGSMDALAPVLNVIRQPVDAVQGMVRGINDILYLRSENARLRDENARLLAWREAAARYERENARLRNLLHVTGEPVTTFVTASVVGESASTFFRTMLLNAGTRDGVEKGQAAIAAEGLAELHLAGDLLCEAHAAGAMDAPRHVGRYQRAKVLVEHHPLLFFVAGTAGAIADCQIL